MKKYILFVSLLLALAGVLPLYAATTTTPTVNSVTQAKNGGTGATSLGANFSNIGGVFSLTDPINAQGTAAAYTILSSDMGKTVTHNKSSSVAVTLPQAGTTGFAAGAAYSEINLGAGSVTITPTSSTINGLSSISLAQYEATYIISDGTNYSAFVARSAGSTVTWPTTGYVVVSNATNSPTGVAEVDGNCLVGVSGSWASASCAGSSSTNLGTSTTATSPQITGDATSGFYTPSAHVLAASTSGVETMQWNTVASGVNYLSVTPGATGVAPKLSMGGGDTNGAGLGVQLLGAAATTTGTGGPVTITGGAGSAGTAGAVAITGGTTGTSFTAGAVTIAGGTTATGTAGSVTINGGTASGAGFGGSVNINAGGATSAVGTINITGAAGGAVTVAGGNIATNATNNGTLTLQSGSATSTGPGANLNITAGSAKGTGVYNGGNVVIAGGALTASTSGTVGMVNLASGYQSTGTKFTTSGCSVSSTTGGAQAGSLTLGANTCSVVVTFNGATKAAATNGWACNAADETSPLIVIAETSSTTSTATLSIPATAGATDVIVFSCVGY